jgi:hypothetical protein
MSKYVQVKTTTGARKKDQGKKKIGKKKSFSAFIVTINTNQRPKDEAVEEDIMKRLEQLNDELFKPDKLVDTGILLFGRYSKQTKSFKEKPLLYESQEEILDRVYTEGHVEYASSGIHVHTIVEVTHDSRIHVWLSHEGILNRFNEIGLIHETDNPYISIRGVRGTLQTMLQYARKGLLSQEQVQEIFTSTH